MTENRKLDTIRKLLAKAERASTPEEAETFAAKAEELMARYSVDRATVAASEPQRADVLNTRTITLDGYPLAKAQILQAVAQNLDCVIVLTGLRSKPGRKVARIHGHESNLEAFDVLATSLLLQATTAATAMHKRTPEVNGRTFRHNFLVGFAARVSHRMAKARRGAVAESAPGTALALVDRAAAVQEHVNSAYHKLGHTSPSVTHNGSYLAGDEAGKRADLSSNERVRAGSQRSSIGAS